MPPAWKPYGRLVRHEIVNEPRMFDEVVACD
jgi:hypothetical protein